MEIRAGFLFLWKPLRLVVHASEGGEENNLFNIHGEKKNTETNIGSANIRLLLLYRLVKKYIIF